MLIKLNIEMSMAELLGKVVKSSNQHRAALATTTVSQPQVGIDLGDRQWLGSAKNILLPQAPFDCHIPGGDGRDAYGSRVSIGEGLGTGSTGRQ